VLKEGDKAPTFNLESDPPGPRPRVSLDDFADRTLVLYFYPRDNTPGCTRQAQGFTALKKALEAAGATVLGVSRDSLKSHASFREKCGVGITLLSDPTLAVHKAYGAWGMKKMYGKDVEGVLRSTFVIDRGKIARVFPNVKVDGHAEAVLQALSPNRNEDTMAAKKSGKKAAKKSAAASLGEAAGDLVAKAVGKFAAAIAPKKGAKKAKAKKAGAGAKKAVKKTAAKVKKKAGGAKKKKAAAKK